MEFQGRCLQLLSLEEGVAELRIDLQGESVNKFNRAALAELAEVLGRLQAAPGVRGLLLTSGKDGFVAGADITEFLEHFKTSEAELTAWLLEVDRLFNTIEDFDFPTVAALNGYALGGGLEFALAAGYRVLAADARIGLPETKLGIFPGWGGTVRLSRLAGADNAIEWIAGGEQHDAAEALRLGVADAVVARDQVRAAALDLLGQCLAGRRDWRARRRQKTAPLRLPPVEAAMVFEGAKAFVGAKAGPDYPAPVAAIQVMQKGAGLDRDAALPIEAAAFARMARTPTAYNLVTLFLGDQAIAKKAKALARTADPVRTAAVLGAGIMGGGIAYQSASKGTPILMKDIREEALQLGLAEARKLMLKRVERGKASPEAMAGTLARIRPTLAYGDFGTADLVVEAVVEHEDLKRKVLAELEGQVRPETILASNTSTIAIGRLAEALERPEHFCGMHFFNPVHRMPLVEVIRGPRTGDRAVATTVGYALALGKTPIVVEDCPGFLVNRVLFPYFAGFLLLVNEGVDFQRIDRAMEAFGWPMGPAYLLDVVGLDTAHHANEVMARSYPDRMTYASRNAIDVLYEQRRFGQKNGKGFYAYEPDPKGVPRKTPDPGVAGLLAPLASHPGEVSDEDLVDRMLLPMIIESARCLEDRVVASPVEVDLGLVYGLGFPPFRGGALRHADRLGLADVCARADRHARLGPLYRPTEGMRRLAETGATFHEGR